MKLDDLFLNNSTSCKFSAKLEAKKNTSNNVCGNKHENLDDIITVSSVTVDKLFF